MNDPQIEMMPLASLTAYDKNSRTHSPEQVKQIAASLREFGFTNPVLIDSSGGIIAGHGRVMAAESMGMVVVPCLRLAHLSEAQKRAYIIADNKLAENAGWNLDLLRLEVLEIQELDFNLDLLGFDEKALEGMLEFLDPNDGLTDEDEVPELPEEPTTKQGDCWQLGNHRIICGSSTDADVVSSVLGGVKPHLMVTDPPYGVEYDADWRNKAMRADGSPIAGRAVGKVLNDDKCDWREAWALFPGDVAYVWHASIMSPEVAASLAVCGFERRALIIWAKSNFAIGRGHYHHKHEPCWYMVKKGGTGHWAGDRKQTTVWDIPKPMKSETGHSTQKPVECMLRPILNNSSPGQAIYEPFSGSGTTIIAAEKSGRICYAVELNPAYVDVAVKRWEQFTGKTAVLEVREYL